MFTLGFVAEHFNVERVDDEVLALKAKIEDVQKRVHEWDETIETQVKFPIYHIFSAVYNIIIH